MFIRRLGACAVFVLAASCCTAEDPTTSTTQQGVCSAFVCGTNTGILGGLPFYMLNLDMMTPSPEAGLVITEFLTAGGNAMRPRVTGHHFFGIRVMDNAWIAGSNLVGSKLTIRNPGTGKTYRVTIESWVQNQPYWEGGFDVSLPKIESFGLSYVEVDKTGIPTTRPHPVCPVPAPSMEWQTGPYDVIIFRGDVFDPTTGEVIATGAATGGWFNIGCAGDAIAKMVVTRYTQDSQGDVPMPIWTDAARRTSATKMWRANYCGDLVQTVTGIPLDWANAGGWNVLGPAATLDNVEAIWGPGGAVCLNHPRYVDITEVPCAGDGPGQVPACTQDQVDHWQDYGEWITVLP